MLSFGKITASLNFESISNNAGRIYAMTVLPGKLAIRPEVPPIST
jgi:hypothetical protein